ncbi:hypothetical protein BDQ12DRAFT_691909 [Crucibulum laeve]|uniref:Uncharacterized protein n=1 Tax=Crucibulum laeve TaxID=68775 RepID=A0A5C3LJS3_9AGAR|nr:hypothetical protein BDQ12DRAFT_691909 [Crucibulum laeve]
MLFKPLLFLSAVFASVVAQDQRPPVFTAERIIHTIIQESPFLVDHTTTVVWTQSSSISETTTATATASA